MRARVAERGERERMGQHRVHRVERAAQVVEDREVDEVRPVAGGEPVVDQRQRPLAARARLRAERAARIGLVVGHVVRARREREHQHRHLVDAREDLVGERRHRRALARQRRARLGQDAPAQPGLAHPRGALGRRQVRDRAVRGERDQRVEAGVQAVEQADRPARRLQAHVDPRGHRALGALGEPAPLLGRVEALEPGQRERPLREPGEQRAVAAGGIVNALVPAQAREGR
ncbi:MAG TPA: hypothetical protein PKC20_14105 [Burkholderiaceae bacterium]|nr:hypothetical protein [Burkholderiaceae bacterium]